MYYIKDCKSLTLRKMSYYYASGKRDLIIRDKIVLQLILVQKDKSYVNYDFFGLLALILIPEKKV